jgi:hypothetical protein
MSRNSPTLDQGFQRKTWGWRVRIVGEFPAAKIGIDVLSECQDFARFLSSRYDR